MTPAMLILGFVTAQRAAELALASRNTRRLRARGAVEAGAAHYPRIVALHAAWLAGLWALAWARPVSPAWLGVYAGLQILRAWTLASLGGRWTTRILVLPGEPLIRRGPYRFLAHPNYVVVIGELAVLPLVFGMPAYALAFSALNALILRIRIREESAALQTAAQRPARPGGHNGA
jgi:methyltransferase